MTYVLHYAPDNASLIVRLVLEELGAPYQTRLVDRAARAQDSAGYRALNPAGLIPALETPDGVIFETGAIILWLADRHGAMAPGAASAGRGDFLKWLFFTSNTLHAQLRMLFYPQKYVGAEAQAQAALRAALTSKSGADMSVPKALALLDARYADGPTEPCVLDCYLCALLRWCALYPVGHTRWFDLSDYPALRALAVTVEARPAAVRAAKADGLGPVPFSNPRPATPPEGSAT